jgi:uncharacterized phiE125 gp8 family phage protein
MIEQTREFSSLPAGAQTQLSNLIVSAREWVENYTGRALVEQTWRLSLDRRLGNGPQGSSWPALPPENGYGWYTGNVNDSISGWLLRKSPVIGIVGFASVDTDGLETEIDPASYRLGEAASKWPSIVPVPTTAWPGEVFRVTFRAGYAPAVGSPDPVSDISLVPQRFKQAIMLHAEAMYDRDERMMSKLLEAAENLIKPECCEFPFA